MYFFPFSIKTSKCSDSCNNINDPYAKLRVPDVVKYLNVRAFNLMSRTSETRHTKWHETCKCKCKLDASVCNTKQRWNEDKCRCECKELIDKGTCDKVIMMLVLINGVKCGTSLRFWENNGWINKIDPCGWFQWYFRYWLGRRSKDDERQINRWKEIVSRFKGKLVKMIKDAGSKFDNSISPKIRQLILHWGYEFIEKDFFINSTNKCIKMSYYHFNRLEILQKAKQRYSKEKAAEYYLKNRETIKEKSKNPYKNLSKEEKDKIKEY